MKQVLTPLFLFFVMAVFPVSAQQTGSFNWILGLQNVRTTDLVPFSAPVQSRTGEKYRLVISPSTDCYCYVVYESSDGDGVMVRGDPEKSQGVEYSGLVTYVKTISIEH